MTKERFGGGVDEALLVSVKKTSWFYEFDLPDGTKTPCDGGASVALLHKTRLDMMDGVIDALERDKRMPKSAIDVGCHQGFFTIELAKRMKAKTYGIDVNHESIEDARRIALLLGADVDFVPMRYGPLKGAARYDLVVCFGLLYHVTDPLGLLDVLCSATAHTILIETQVAAEVTAHAHSIPWSISAEKPIDGWFAYVKDDGQGRESGTTGYALVPTMQTLMRMLEDRGFSAELVAVPEDGHPRLTHLDRVMVRGTRREST